MADPKYNAKLTGDTHPPEVESDMPQKGLREAEETPAASEERVRRRPRKPKQAARSPESSRAGWSPDDPEPKDETRLG